MPNIIQTRRVLLRAAAAAGGGGGFTATSTESSNFLARATTITDNTDKTRYDALISGLVSDGDFSTLDALKIYSAPNQTAAPLNLIQNAYNSVEHGTPNFTAYQGYTGNGTDFYLDTGFGASTAPSPNYVLDSASIGVYVQTNFASGGEAANCTMGSQENGSGRIIPYYYGDVYWKLNDISDSTIASSTSQGLWIATRTASNARALYRNGNTTAFDTSTQASTAVPDASYTIFANNSAGGASAFATLQISATFIGGGLSSAAQARIAARINTFHATLPTPINVY